MSVAAADIDARTASRLFRSLEPIELSSMDVESKPYVLVRLLPAAPNGWWLSHHVFGEADQTCLKRAIPGWLVSEYLDHLGYPWWKRGWKVTGCHKRYETDPFGPRPKASGPRAGYVYFIRAGDAGPIKIGWAIDPLARRDKVQAFMPERLQVVAQFPGTVTDETALHREFASARLYGAWFSPTPNLLARIGEVCCGRS